MKYFMILILIVLASCHGNNSNNPDLVEPDVQDSIKLMMVNVTGSLAEHGPAAWLQYFEDSSVFYMVNDGQLAFDNYKTAKRFTDSTLVKALRSVDLHWSNLRIDPLTAKLGSVGADFYENLTDSSGKVIPVRGYFTATAEKTAAGWRFRNAHWSQLRTN